jgi:acetylornithine deacetylase/succinyl-diaminopimelate desuccinylase-like protein
VGWDFNSVRQCKEVDVIHRVIIGETWWVVIACLTFWILLWVPAGAQERYPVPWDQVEKDTLEHFQKLVRINTTNPPGNETPVAEYVKKVLEKEGISAELLALDPKRANLVARIRGNGSKRPILVMGHTDVVGVQKEKWSVDPFAAVRKDGYIWGRGTLDDKDNVTAGLMLMLLLKRQGVKLDRDVILLCEAGEEGYAKEGLRHVIDKHWEEIDAEFALAEGGGGLISGEKARRVNIATTEKYRWRVHLLAKGRAGHGSRPTPESAVLKIANAVAKIGAWVPEMKLSETTRTYFERLAEISPPEEAARYRAILDPAKRADAERYFAQNEPQHNSMIRTTLAPTVLKAGFRDNVIPSEAEATIDIRALPEEDMTQFRRRLEEVISDPSIEIKPNIGRDKAPASKLDTEMWAALEKTQKRLYPEATLLPAMLTGASDLSPLRSKGVQAYGIGPLMLEKDFKEGVDAHSDNERILEKSLHDFVRFVWYAVLEIAATK